MYRALWYCKTSTYFGITKINIDITIDICIYTGITKYLNHNTYMYVYLSYGTMQKVKLVSGSCVANYKMYM